ncbi:MAG TPA: hypothetical protein V6D20_25310 [Candidatus Obscuribacterales bacterium]
MSIFLHRSGLLRGAGDFVPPAFDPVSLFGGGEFGGLYDPSDLSTLWQDTAATTPVTADGQVVRRMDDLSGNANHMTEATNPPVYKTNGTLHWLLFDGSNDRLSTSPGSTKVFSSSGGSLFVGYEITENNTLNSAIAEASETTNFVRINIAGDTRTTPNRFSIYNPSGLNETLDYSAKQDPDTRTAIITAGSTTASGYKDGTLIDSGTARGGISTNVRIWLFYEPSPASYMTGKFYGGGAIDRELTSTEISNLTTWMQGKAGL